MSYKLELKASTKNEWAKLDTSIVTALLTCPYPQCREIKRFHYRINYL